MTIKCTFIELNKQDKTVNPLFKLRKKEICDLQNMHLLCSCVLSMEYMFRANSCRNLLQGKGTGECCKRARNSFSICSAASWKLSILQKKRQNDYSKSNISRHVHTVLQKRNLFTSQQLYTGHPSPPRSYIANQSEWSYKILNPCSQKTEILFSKVLARCQL